MTIHCGQVFLNYISKGVRYEIDEGEIFSVDLQTKLSLEDYRDSRVVECLCVSGWFLSS